MIRKLLVAGAAAAISIPLALAGSADAAAKPVKNCSTTVKTTCSYSFLDGTGAVTKVQYKGVATGNGTVMVQTYLNSCGGSPVATSPSKKAKSGKQVVINQTFNPPQVIPPGLTLCQRFEGTGAPAGEIIINT